VTVPVRATVRFGTLRLAVALGHERYARAFDTHLRAPLLPPPAHGDPVDLSIEVVEVEPVGAAAPDAVDRLQVTRHGSSTTWTSLAGEATLRGRDARIAMRPGVVIEHELLFSFSVFIQQLLLALGLVRLHAGGAVVGDRTVVFVGDKGAGKSTLALGLGQRGALVLGDDQLAIQTSGASLVVAGSYPGIRLTADTEALLPAPLDVEPVMLAGVAKKEVALEEVVPAAPYLPHVPTDLWFPEVGEGFALTPMRGQEALARLVGALAPLHRFADGRDRRDLIDLVHRLVSVTSIRQVTLSRDLRDLSRAWDELAG
jgi:hypothetical protein